MGFLVCALALLANSLREERMTRNPVRTIPTSEESRPSPKRKPPVAEAPIASTPVFRLDSRSGLIQLPTESDEGVLVYLDDELYVPAILVGSQKVVRNGDLHVVPPGRYEIRSARLRALLGRVEVRSDDMKIEVTLEPRHMVVERTDGTTERTPLPRITRLRFEGGHVSGLRAEVDEVEHFLAPSDDRVVLPDGVPVKFTLLTGVTIPAPKSRLVREYVPELVFRSRTAWMRPFANGEQQFGEVVLYRAGDRTTPVSRSAWFSSPMTQAASMIHAPYSAPAGRYDIWWEPFGYRGKWMRGVDLDGGDVDLDWILFERGATVVIPLRAGEAQGRLRSLARPYESIHQCRGSAPRTQAEFSVHGTGPYEWSSGSLKLRIDVPAGVETYTVPR